MQGNNQRPLHERLARLRAIGLTQKAIAQEIGITQPTVSNLLLPLAPGMKKRRYSANVIEGVMRLEAAHSASLAQLA
jgi:transcriptional regulator with XRE-family HTH domain